jgi:hypothetical protein
LLLLLLKLLLLELLLLLLDLLLLLKLLLLLLILLLLLELLLLLLWELLLLQHHWLVLRLWHCCKLGRCYSCSLYLLLPVDVCCSTCCLGHSLCLGPLPPLSQPPGCCASLIDLCSPEYVCAEKGAPCGVCARCMDILCSGY